MWRLLSCDMFRGAVFSATFGSQDGLAHQTILEYQLPQVPAILPTCPRPPLLSDDSSIREMRRVPWHIPASYLEIKNWPEPRVVALPRPVHRQRHIQMWCSESVWIMEFPEFYICTNTLKWVNVLFESQISQSAVLSLADCSKGNCRPKNIGWEVAIVTAYPGVCDVC